VRGGELGRVYADREIIVRQGDVGDCMYVIQTGEVEVVQTVEGGEQQLARLSAGDFFGEMAIFERELRSATVRAVGEARILKLDKRTLLRRIQEDPLLAVNLFRALSERLRDMNARLARAREAAG
jgi:CRP/FNR family cyclic AMP-dependent transcriptional regulator